MAVTRKRAVAGKAKPAAPAAAAAASVATPVSDPLYRDIRAVLDAARASAYRAVNTAMVQAYWQVGRLVVEHEQGGHRRAAYGEAVLADLARRLTADFGRGFDVRSLRYMRQFYLAFPPTEAASQSAGSGTGKRNAVRSELAESAKRNAVRSELSVARPELSWTHYRLLLSVEDASARTWYINEAAEQNWSTRQLERQIAMLVGALTHQDIGQMDSYVRMFDAHVRPKEDNPTIGLILCSKKNEAVAKYSVLSEGKRLFAAKYMKLLPTEAELKREIERERRAIDARHTAGEKR